MCSKNTRLSEKEGSCTRNENHSLYPAKYCATLRTKWRYTVCLTDGHKDNFFRLWFALLPPSTKRKMTIALRGSFLAILVAAQKIVDRANYVLCPSLKHHVHPHLHLKGIKYFTGYSYLCFLRLKSRQKFIAIFAHSIFTAGSQNNIYSGYNWLFHYQQN